MNLYISHMSALRYWRQEEGLSTTTESAVHTLYDAVTNTMDARTIAPAEHGLIMSRNAPLDILVNNQSSRRYAKSLTPHLWSSAIPRHAFRQLAPHLYISSPEFAFVQLASSLSVIELAQLGNELCGGYFLLATSGFCERPRKKPLTTKEHLESFVASVAGGRGAHKAQRALRWTVDHCNSPMETNVLLALCLPSKMAGWSLRLPSVNEEIAVGKRMMRYVDGSTYIPDFLWRRKLKGRTIHVAGEYDSHEHHDEDQKAEKTRIRRNNMKALGYLVTSINKSQIASAAAFQYPARQIARDLGLYRPVPDEDRLRKQDELFKLLRREAFR